uniref:Large ribosomal subunit protein uL11m n=1 Tax=Romanomermis culicivorax TaxID=13658 RepID=A0A915I2K6_ROMCU
MLKVPVMFPPDKAVQYIKKFPRKVLGKPKPEKVEHPPYYFTVVKAGMAAPAPPLGPELGERGLNVAGFCKDFNEKTKSYFAGVPLPVDLDINPDRSYKMELRTPTSEWMLLRAAGVRKASLDPKIEVCGKVTVKHLYEIAKIKKQDNWLKGYSLRHICETLLEECRKLGIQVVHRLDPVEYREFLEQRKIVVDEQIKAAEEAKAAKLLRMAEATMVDMEALTDYYTTNFSSCYSPDGKYLAVADSCGRIFIFGLAKLLRSNVTTTKVNRCTFSLKRKQCAIYVLITIDDQLLCGCSDGTVVAYSWIDICKQKIHQLYAFGADNQSSEVNCILGEKQNESVPRVFTSGGDNMIHLWDIENKKEMHKLAGHTDYIHALAHGPHGTLISGSEDGTIRFWDVKAGTKPIHVIKPFESDCSNPNRGKWIGAVASNSDFV